MESVCDSAVGRDVMPLFVPDWGEWSLEGRIAFRIERLGKNVAEKFAIRYVDAYGAVAVLRPADGTEVSCWPIMDSAVTTGQWLPLPEGDIQAEWSLGDITESFTIGADDWRQALVASIAEATRIATIKTGDIIIPPLPTFTTNPILNQRLTALLSSTPSLRLKIK